MRKFIPLVLLIVVVSALFAQDSKIHLGIQAGPGITKSYGNPFLKSIAADIGYSAGLFLQGNITKGFSIKTGVNYERKGYASKQERTTVQNPNGGFDSDRQHWFYNYLVIPVLAQANFGPKAIRFFINGGPYAAILLNAHISTPQSNDPAWNYNLTSIYKPIDVGVMLGAGFSVPIKKGFAFLFEIRNSVGLLNTSASPYLANTKTYSTLLLLGFEYQFKRKAAK